MKSDVWKFLRVSEDVEKKLVTYDFKIIGEGEDVVSFVLGNIGNACIPGRRTQSRNGW